ncbi:NlpC/P60 family protein [Streptomyces phyllanthi]|uniref:NlpC/P60 family protein n=1 Tax=Streptomyces phyllanthi TaxID=1803180 RepID=A0A5N8WE40_9ACTN|nr:NlpC/P60 family protein [Streptomyces phyllanthi]MPY45106.1 NlpC/P60 family protein [Streptomyces phyllanthi]
MSPLNRRSALAALAGAAAASPLLPGPGTAVARAATDTAATASATVGATSATAVDVARQGSSLLVSANDPAWFPEHAAGALTATPVAATASAPALLEVTDGRGWLATLTHGAKTVTVRGPRRWLTEQKKPFTDTFARTPASGWGASPGGGTWSTHNGADADYRVEDGRGVIELTAANASRHAFLSSDRDIADLNATAVFGFDRAPSGAAASLALSFAYDDMDNHYRARLNVTAAGAVQLLLEKEEADAVTVLGAAQQVGTGFTASDRWRVRVEKEGSALRTRAWRDGTAEPSSWQHSVTDPTFTQGRVGVRALASSGSTALPLKALVSEFAVESAYWADPPVVSHETWVRVLPEPFDGGWTNAMEQRIRAWAADTSPDALAYGAMFLPGGATVRSSVLDGVQVLGEAGYGPLKADGTRREGADFHEYMGVEWTFPNGERRPYAGLQWEGNLDCSGLVRMVYGHHMGLPLVYERDHDGVNLPRLSRDQAASGPGVVVARATAAAPSLAGLRIGDLVCFDATDDDTDDTTDEDGVVDHVGIYVGEDQHGNPRFLSSRKTPNGPTIGDLGGPSTLNGTGLYARTLRLIRRF